MCPFRFFLMYPQAQQQLNYLFNEIVARFETTGQKPKVLSFVVAAAALVVSSIVCTYVACSCYCRENAHKKYYS